MKLDEFILGTREYEYWGLRVVFWLIEGWKYLNKYTKVTWILERVLTIV